MSATESSTTSSSNAILVFANRTNDNNYNIIIIAHVLCFDNDRAVHMKRRAALAASTLE